MYTVGKRGRRGRQEVGDTQLGDTQLGWKKKRWFQMPTKSNLDGKEPSLSWTNKKNVQSRVFI